jgi:hypothetical protein
MIEAHELTTVACGRYHPLARLKAHTRQHRWWGPPAGARARSGPPGVVRSGLP